MMVTGRSWDASCNCVGIPPAELVTLEITFGRPGQRPPGIRDETGTQVIQSGGPYADGQGGTVITDLPLVLLRTGSSRTPVAMVADGGYTLRPQSRQIINGQWVVRFRQPDGERDGLLPTAEVRSFLKAGVTKPSGLYQLDPGLYASARPGASGFQFWMFDPHGTPIPRRVQHHSRI